MNRKDRDKAVDEAESLKQFLDFQRATLMWKGGGLDASGMAKQLGPSALTLAGIIKHLALVEDSWFQEVFLGRELPEPWAGASWEDDPDWEFHSAIEDDPAELLALYQAACERSRVAVKSAPNMDALSVGKSRDGSLFSLRWIMLHMIEETARHNGHADLLRENVDGLTGE